MEVKWEHQEKSGSGIPTLRKTREQTKLGEIYWRRTRMKEPSVFKVLRVR